MKTIKITDLSTLKEFTNHNYTLKQIVYNTNTNTGVWQLFDIDNNPCGYEIVKGVLTLDNNFKVHYTYPSDDQFGDYGWYVGSYNRAIEVYNQLQI